MGAGCVIGMKNDVFLWNWKVHAPDCKDYLLQRMAQLAVFLKIEIQDGKVVWNRTFRRPLLSTECKILKIAKNVIGFAHIHGSAKLEDMEGSREVSSVKLVLTP